MKNAIVTGASSGFGMLTAIELAKSGFKVVATLRDEKRANQLLSQAISENVSEKIVIHLLDVTSAESIRSFKHTLKDYHSIDVLVNNAGFAQGGFCEELSIEEYKEQFDTNFFGLISVTQAVLPKMRTQRSGTIINMGSISGRFGFPGLSAYTSSKHALEGLSESLRLELKPFGIHVVLIEPGSYSTNIWSNIEKVHVKEDSPYHSPMMRLMSEIESSKDHHGDPYEVAKLVSRIATDSNPKFRYPVGKGVRSLLLLKSFFPWSFIEKIVLRKLQ